MASEYSGVPTSANEQHCVRDYRRQFAMIYYDHLALWTDSKNELKPSALAVYICLIKHASNYDHRCFPSLETIGKETNQSRPTVVSAVRKLKAAGLIAIQKEKVTGGYERSVYTLLDTSPIAFSGESKNFTEGEKDLPDSCETRSKNFTRLGKESLPKLDPVKLETKKTERYLADDEKLIDVWAQECNGDAWPIEVGMARKAAKKLITGGFDEAEAYELIAWLRQQDWRKSGITVSLMASQADNFRAAKREGKTVRRTADKHGGLVYG